MDVKQEKDQVFACILDTHTGECSHQEMANHTSVGYRVRLSGAMHQLSLNAKGRYMVIDLDDAPRELPSVLQLLREGANAEPITRLYQSQSDYARQTAQ